MSNASGARWHLKVDTTKPMADHIDSFRARPAVRGKAGRKAELLKEYWQVNNMITHYIISGAGGDKSGPSKRAEAEAELATIACELRGITKDPR